MSCDVCVIFTTDVGYLVPTLVAAEQVYQQAKDDNLADVIIFTIDLAEDVQAYIQKEFPYITFISVNLTVDETKFFNKSHVPRSALARLSIGRDIPERYEHVVYLDGDIQIVGDIRPLLRHQVPVGMIAASCESAQLYCTEKTREAEKFAAYAQSIGLSEARDYFNSGVLAARRTSWIAIGDAALNYFNEHSDLCLYHDQTALNAVCVGRRQILHPRYNFVSWFRYMRAEQIMEPAIFHFTGSQKPWSRSRPAMNGRFTGVYDDFIKRHPYLQPAFEATSGLNWQGSGRLPRDWRWPWRIPMRRGRFRRFLKEATFAF